MDFLPIAPELAREDDDMDAEGELEDDYEEGLTVIAKYECQTNPERPGPMGTAGHLLDGGMNTAGEPEDHSDSDSMIIPRYECLTTLEPAMEDIDHLADKDPDAAGELVGDYDMIIATYRCPLVLETQTVANVNPVLPSPEIPSDRGRQIEPERNEADLGGHTGKKGAGRRGRPDHWVIKLANGRELYSGIRLNGVLKFICLNTKCEKQASRACQMKTHVLNHLAGSLGVGCPMCNKRSNRRNRLKEHLLRAHNVHSAERLAEEAFKAEVAKFKMVKEVISYSRC